MKLNASSKSFLHDRSTASLLTNNVIENNMQYVKSFAVVDQILGMIMENFDIKILMRDLDKKMKPFVNERVLSDCRATFYFFTILPDYKQFLIEEDEEEEPKQAKPDNGATDYIKKNKIIIEANAVDLPAQESHPDFSILKDQSMLSLLSYKGRSKQNSSSMSKKQNQQCLILISSAKKQQPEEDKSLIFDYQTQVVKLNLMGANDDEDDHVIRTRKIFLLKKFLKRNVKKTIIMHQQESQKLLRPQQESQKSIPVINELSSQLSHLLKPSSKLNASQLIHPSYCIKDNNESKLSKQNIKSKYPSQKTIIIQNSQQKSLTEDEQLMSTVLNETIDISNPYQSFGEKREVIIPTDQYNPSTGIVIKGGVKLKDRSSLIEGGEYESQDNSKSRLNFKQYQKISQNRRYQHELIKEKTLTNVFSSDRNLKQRANDQNDILNTSAKEKIREIASRGNIVNSSLNCGKQRISNRIIRNNQNLTADNTLITGDNPRSLNQSINYLESLKSHDQLGDLNPLLNVISNQSSQIQILATDPYSNLNFQSPQLLNKYQFNNINRSQDSKFNKYQSNLDSQANFYLGQGDQGDSKQNRRYLLTRNSMQLAENLKQKPSQDRIQLYNRNTSNNNTHNLASLNTSIVSGSSLQKRIRTGNINQSIQNKNSKQTMRIRNFKIGGGTQKVIRD